MKVLVIAPHPDDETLCCGGILARHVERGDDVRVLIVTDGRYGAPTPELYGTDQLVRTRIEESRKATSKLGIPWENLVFMNFEDSRIKVLKAEVEVKIKEVLNRLKPDLIYSPLPYDNHGDHSELGRIMVKLAPHSRFYLIWIPNSVNKRIELMKLKTWQKIEILIEKYRKNKIDALMEYRSQLGGFNEEFLRRFTRKSETFYVRST
ncbi:PIG-L family deacetylase [Metallosphaera hakonensis JCM 8857 = DSM 7519]|uniref:PIG-L family deacetylase n=1 Tax=Metallosphaera hakonensis JCM 8857 = DSM 7519 TaxID=1293036 RepID=A0A2U9IXK3_9CREN|nr:PIG-L family deacetylase [Metallosphaera hakonensis JCM 8857 = DSM 7519]